jgi:transposase
MEDILDIYARPYDARRPQVCFDEHMVQLIAESRQPLPPKPGCPERFDYEYRRNGTRNLFLFFQPLAGWRQVRVTERRTRADFAECMSYLVDELFPEAEKVVVVLDNLNTHDPASLYEAFEPAEAKRILDRLEFHYTPKHGSWLNMVEIEIGVLCEQCLADRLPDEDTLRREIAAWEKERNDQQATVNWHFTTIDARNKLKRLYPVISKSS